MNLSTTYRLLDVCLLVMRFIKQITSGVRPVSGEDIFSNHEPQFDGGAFGWCIG